MRPPFAVLFADEVGSSLEEQLRRALSTDVSLVVVDDGSVGDAARVASRLGAEAIRHPAKFGRAQAVLSGIYYAISEESPGSIIIARADAPDLALALPDLRQAMEETPDTLVVAVDRGPLPAQVAAALGLARWLRKGAGPAYAAPTEVLRSLTLGRYDRGPEASLLWRAARGQLRLRTIS